MLAARLVILLGLAPAFLAAPLAAVENERLYLSGTGYGDTRDWEFRIEDGRRAGEGWTTIAVPSQWEQEGFGAYRYGRHDGSGGETGHYRHRFETPPEWRGRRVRLVFGGVMTDTEARLNGQSVGPVHQGGFTRFSYDVTELLAAEGENLLEVTVAEESADRSVEKAEREADYWVFGGIYRPVWLEASPPIAIAHVAIDARHDGRLSVEVEVEGESDGTRVVARVQRLDGSPIGSELSGRPASDGGRLTLEGRIRGAEPWSAERPRLYELRLRLERGGEVLHTTIRRFGFRTFEVRRGEGLFVNDRRVLLRGINRHSFWPDSGRTLNDAINRRDAELLKKLNANAVRASHYPPDEAFLDACDELGLYVIDELPGWHDAYDTTVGEKLVAEMVRRDVNHPSILFWANGNEGGWNTALDDDFAKHDPQRRPVLHPDEVFAGIETFHYQTYRQLADSLDDGTIFNRARAWLGRPRLVMPTEMLHGLYDGGHGAGLEGFWELLRTSPRGAGGFLWAFLDEGVARTDRDGAIDTFGNYAPDGLVGPYREKEPSFRTVRRVWSPVQIDEVRMVGRSDGFVRLENRFTEIGLEECRLAWRALSWPAPGGEPKLVGSGGARGPSVAPGGAGVARLDLPPEPFDALEISIFDPAERKLGTWALPLTSTADLVRRWVPEASEQVRLARRPSPTADEVRLRAGSREVVLGDGRLVALRDGTTGIPVGGGPRPVGEERDERTVAEAGVLETLETDGRQVYYTVDDEGYALETWTLFASGWLRLDYAYRRTNRRQWLQGITFELPESWIRTIEWLGRGPDPVWLNRLAGPRLGVWRRDLAPPHSGDDPRGFYDGVRWMRLVGENGTLTLVVPGDHARVGVSAPPFPEDARGAVAEVPAAGTLSLLDRISPMGTKFHSGEALIWPDVLLEPAPLPRGGTVWFFWEALP